MRNALIALIAALCAVGLGWLASSPSADSAGPSRNRTFPTTPTTVEVHFGRAPVAGAEIPRVASR